MKRMSAVLVCGVLAAALSGAAAWAGQPLGPRFGMADVFGQNIFVTQEFALKRLPADDWLLTEAAPGSIAIDAQKAQCVLQSGAGGAAILESNARGSVETYSITFFARVRLQDAAAAARFGLASDEPDKAAVLIENDREQFILKIRGGEKEESLPFAPIDDQWHTYEIRVEKTSVVLRVDGAELLRTVSSPPTAALAAFFQVKESNGNRLEIDRVRLNLMPHELAARMQEFRQRQPAAGDQPRQRRPRNQ